MHSIGKAPAEVRITSPKTSAEKVIVKALAAIVNPQGNKKKPGRRVDLFSSDSPWI
jgi:hypothetical protein